MKNCSLWERPKLEKFMEDCLPWEGPHSGPGEEHEKERAPSLLHSGQGNRTFLHRIIES